MRYGQKNGFIISTVKIYGEKVNYEEANPASYIVVLNEREYVWIFTNVYGVIILQTLAGDRGSGQDQAITWTTTTKTVSGKISLNKKAIQTVGNIW